jgi:hypothetical protein
MYGGGSFASANIIKIALMIIQTFTVRHASTDSVHLQSERA